MNNIGKKSLAYHRKNRGKIEIQSKVKLKTANDLCLAYTPGVAEVSKEISKNPDKVFSYTMKSNLVAVVSDGSAVLGLGNKGAYSAVPVMEGKCAIFKNFAGVDAFPVCLKTQDEKEIVNIIKNISPVFGGINLEDIAAPKCFSIEKELSKSLKIPVFHDDQDGTAIVVLAGLVNALKIVKKDLKKIKIVVNGAGAAGYAIVKILYSFGAKKIFLLDSKGLVSRKRDYLYPHKKELLRYLSPQSGLGNLKTALREADVFIGVSKGKLFKVSYLKLMNVDPVIFALANPIPEVNPEEAIKNGAKIVATGRSDFPNQLNNALVFPGLFRGLLDGKIQKVTMEMKIKAGLALANLIRSPKTTKIIPSIFDIRVSPAIAKSIKNSR